MINIDDFGKVEIKIGTILTAEKVENADKLLRLTVDFGTTKKVVPAAEGAVKEDGTSADPTTIEEVDVRQIISGIAMHYLDPQVLVGKQCPFVTNLEPRTIKGLESRGMICATSGEGFFSLLHPSAPVPPGAKIK
ncbi:MAG: hypothetical protein WC757_02990 [Candidatus Paceibacterota bacterium]|jgi:methionyl-tRNA synthetase